MTLSKQKSFARLAHFWREREEEEEEGSEVCETNAADQVLVPRPLACLFADRRQVGSDVSVGRVGQPRHLLGAGAAEHGTQLLLQDVGTLCSAGDADLQA